MNFSLLAMRLHLQYFSVAPPGEPVLEVGEKSVTAVWDCGCCGSGSDFEALRYLPCLTHDRIRMLDLSKLIAGSRHEMDSRRALV